MKNLLSFFVILTPILIIEALFTPYNTYAETANSQVITLSPGWNIVSTPRILTSHQFSAAETSDNFDIYLLDPTSPSNWQTMQGSGQSEFQPLFAYFINNKTGNDQTLTFIYNFDLTPAQRLFQRTLQPGWNAIGIASTTYALPQGSTNTDTNNPSNILNPIRESVSQVIDFTNSNLNPDSSFISGYWRSVTIADVNSLNDFRELKGYGIFTTSATNNYIGSQDLSLSTQYTLSYTAGPNGSITGNQLQMVTPGANGTAITAVPDAGYSFTGWSDGVHQNPRTDTNVQSDINVTANFTAFDSPTFVVENTFSSQTDIPGGATNAVIGKFTLRSYGEAVKVSSLTITPTLTSTTPAVNGLNNVTLYFNGSQIGSSQNWTSGPLDFELGNQMIVPVEYDSTLEIRADLQTSSSVSYTAGTVAVTVVQGLSNAEGQTSKKTVDIPTIDVSTTGLTITSGSLEVTANPSVSGGNIAPNSTGVKIGSYTIRNSGTSEAVRLTSLRIKLTNGTTQLTSDTTPKLSNFSALRTSETSGSGSYPIQPDGDDTFSIDKTLNADQPMTIDIYAGTGSETSGQIQTTLTVGYIGAIGGISSISSEVFGQTMMLGVGSLSCPTLIVSQTTAAQYIPSAVSGQASSKATFSFISTSGASTINELRFTVSASTTVASVCVGSVCATPISGTATLTGLSLAVPVSGGLNQEVTITYPTVGTDGLTPGTNSQVSLSYVKYVAGGITKTLSTNENSNTNRYCQPVSAPIVTLVGSVPTITINSGSGSSLNLSAQNKISSVTVKADAQGAIKMRQIQFAVSNSGFSTGDPMDILDNPGTTPFLALAGSQTQISGNYCNIADNIITCELGGMGNINYANDFLIPANYQTTFDLYATVGGLSASGAKASVSTSLRAAGCLWDDTSTNGASGTGFTCELIYGFPTGSYTISQQ